MNLGIVVGRFPPNVFGGAEIQAEQWARRLSDRHRVTVITRREPGPESGRAGGEGFEVIRLARSNLPIWRTAADLARIEASVRGCAARPDVLLCFQTFLSGYAGVRIQRRLGIPAVVWVRGEDEFRVASRRTRWISIPTWSAATAVLVQSDSIRDAVLAAVRRLRPGDEARIAAKLEVIPNGIAVPDDVSAPPPLGPSAVDGPVLAVGRLIPDKGMDVVIDAVAAAGLPLVIAGDGPERVALESRARSVRAAVKFAGAVPRDSLDDLYRSAGVVVLASRRGEGMPNALLEAMAWGRPVVATPVPGVTDLVRDGENGLMVPAGDPVALGQALVRIRSDRPLAGRLADSGRRTAGNFRWEAIRPRLEQGLERWRRR